MFCGLWSTSLSKSLISSVTNRRRLARYSVARAYPSAPHPLNFALPNPPPRVLAPARGRVAFSGARAFIGDRAFASGGEHDASHILSLLVCYFWQSLGCIRNQLRPNQLLYT